MVRLDVCISATFFFSHRWGQQRENGVRGIHALATWSGIRVSQGNAEDKGQDRHNERVFARRTRTGTGTLMALALGKRKYRMYEYERMQVVSLMTKKTRWIRKTENDDASEFEESGSITLPVRHCRTDIKVNGQDGAAETLGNTVMARSRFYSFVPFSIFKSQGADVPWLAGP